MKQIFYFLCALFLFWSHLVFALSLAKMQAIVAQDPTGIVTQHLPVKLFFSNPAAFQEVLTILREAKPGEKIFIESFEFHNDVVGRIFSAEVIAAVKRGVHVSCLIDGLGLNRWWYVNEAKKNRANVIPLFNVMAKEGAAIYIYNSRNIATKGFQNNLRNHRKLVMRVHQDGTAVLFIGGRNLGDFYYTDLEGSQTIVDINARILLKDREVARRIYDNECRALLEQSWLSERFLPPQDYSLSDHERFMGALLEQAKKDQAAIASKAVAAALDLPEVDVEYAAFFQHEHNIAKQYSASYLNALNELLKHAEHRALLASAYFLPQKDLEKTLLTLLKQGLNVEIYTNSDVSTKHTSLIRLMRQYIQNLLNHGLRLNLRNEGELHAKVGTIDESVAMLGSANLNARSWRSDLENGWFFYSPELVRQIENFFEVKKRAGEFHLPTLKDRHLGLGHYCSVLGLIPLKRFF